MSDKAEEPLILARGLSKVYQMGETEVHALRGVDFQVNRGEFVAIVGQSGSGKSTLMHILGCLDTPTDGEISIAGEDVSAYSESDLAEIRNSTIGFVFQTFNLLPRFSLTRNTQLPMTYGGVPGRVRRQRATELLTRVGLDDRLDHRPSQLSGGQCQRAAIARALVTDPEIILADEPTGNLDSESGEMILNVLRELHAEGHTIILVTHEDRIANAAHRQIRILDGRIVEDTGRGSPAPLEKPAMSNEEDTPKPEPFRPRRKKKGRRWIKRMIILLLLIGAGFWAKNTFFQEAEDPMASLKDPISIEKGEVEERLLETGSVELKTTIEVKSKMSGKVKQLLVEEGDRVKEGDVLAVIEPDPNEVLRLYQKRAAVESSRLNLQEKRRALVRSTELHKSGVMPPDQFEKVQDAVTASETTYQVAHLELQALEREINPAFEAAGLNSQDAATTSNDAALSRLTDIQVVAPRAGIVIERPVDVGELVISGTATTIAGTSIMKLGDPAEAIVKAAVNEVDISKIKAGQEVEITLSAYEKETFPAKVHRIAPIGTKVQGQNIVSFHVEIRFAELDTRIMPGMSCDLDIIIQRKSDARYLPYSAIFQEREKKEGEEKASEDEKKGEDDHEEQAFIDYVWVKKGESDWEKTKVELGLKGMKRVEIAEGPSDEAKIYPDAERLRWMLNERDRKAKKKKWYQKKKTTDEEESEE